MSALALGLAPSKASSDSFGGFMLKDWISASEETKTLYTKVIMEQAGVHGVRLQYPPRLYQTELDQLARFSMEKHHEKLLEAPVAQSLATIAIINCDWNNGVDAYEFALKYLGREKLELLKELYADAITHLQNNCQ